MTIPGDAYAIIIGAMKSATTSFYFYLAQHPEICPAIVKEPEFFSERQSHKIRCERYSDLWLFNSNKHRVALEASTGYTKYSLEANVPKRIFEYAIRPKFIYCVRNPFERIISHYQFLSRFSSIGRQVLVSPHLIKLSSYFLQLEQYLKYFSMVDMLIIDFDEICLGAQKAADKAFLFLGVSSLSIDSSRIYNKSITTTGFWDGSRLVNSEYLTEFERGYIFDSLQSDMRSFKTIFGFDTSKWGF